MLSLGSGQHSHLFVFVLLLQVCFFCFWFLNDYRNNTLKTNIFFFSFLFVYVERTLLFVTIFSVMLEISIFRFCSFLCNERFTNLFMFVSYLLQFFVSIIFIFCRLQFFFFCIQIFFKTAVIDWVRFY